MVSIHCSFFGRVYIYKAMLTFRIYCWSLAPMKPNSADFLGNCFVEGCFFVCFPFRPIVCLLQGSTFIAPVFNCPIFPSCLGMICQQFIYMLECNFSAVKVPVPTWHGLLGSNLNDLSRKAMHSHSTGSIKLP